MKTTVALLSGTATIADGHWTASRPAILRIVRGVTPSMLDTAYEPDFDLALAEYAARIFGGQVTVYAGPPTIVAGHDY